MSIALSNLIRTYGRRQAIRQRLLNAITNSSNSASNQNHYSNRIGSRCTRTIMTKKQSPIPAKKGPKKAEPSKPDKIISESHEDSNLLNAPRVRGRDDDSLSRFPNFRTPGGILRGLDYGGTLTFAMSGTITAAQSGLDVFGCSMVAMITAVGGGTIRDAVFLARRPFWTSETEYIWMSVITGFLTFFTWPLVLGWKEERRMLKEKKDRQMDHCEDIERNSKGLEGEGGSCNDDYYDEVDAVLDTFDAIGLAAFAIIGAQNGVRAGMPIVVSAICGMATSTFGGLTRDVLCGRPVRIVHSNAEVYAQPALAGAVTYLGAKGMNLSPGLRIGSAMFVCLGSRYMAVKHDVKLYTWESKDDNDGLGVAVRK